jgi:anti-sigma factor (TIGR02949 family)
MDCRERENQISMLLDGELQPSASEELVRHVATCKSCRIVYDGMLALNVDLKASARDVAMPSNLPARIKERISAARNREFDKGLAIIWRQVPIMAMIVLLAIGLGNLAGRSVSDILLSDRQNTIVQSIMPDTGESLGDLLMDVIPEGNGQ